MAILHGREKIKKYCGRGWATIMELRRTRGFPVVKIHGRWESTTKDIDNWRQRQYMVPPEKKEHGG